MPAKPRSQIVDNFEISTYHCTQRVVRRGFLCGLDSLTGKNYNHRKKWIKERLAMLAEIFFIDILSYAVMSNHLHTMLRVRPDLSFAASDEDICRRWFKLYPKRKNGQVPTEIPAELLDQWLQDPEFIAERRKRLHDLSWFMRCLSEPIARRANKEDGVTGRFGKEDSSPSVF